MAPEQAPKQAQALVLALERFQEDIANTIRSGYYNTFPRHNTLDHSTFFLHIVAKPLNKLSKTGLVWVGVVERVGVGWVVEKVGERV